MRHRRRAYVRAPGEPVGMATTRFEVVVDGWRFDVLVEGGPNGPAREGASQRRRLALVGRGVRALIPGGRVGGGRAGDPVGPASRCSPWRP